MTALYGFIAVTLAAFLATGLALKLLRRAQILDHPNERSSHSLPTPKGAGLALIPVLIAAWAWLAAQQGAFHLWPVLAAAAGLCLLSWLDDLKGLPALARLAAQGLAVAVGLFVLGPQGSVTQGLLPAWADLLFAWLAWLWFVNIFNFMDGIDGITGVESLTVALGLALIAVLDLALGEGYALLLFKLLEVSAAARRTRRAPLLLQGCKFQHRVGHRLLPGTALLVEVINFDLAAKRGGDDGEQCDGWHSEPNVRHHSALS